MNPIPAEYLARESDDPLALAFDRMILSGAMMDLMSPRAAVEPPSDWAAFLERGRGRPAAAYVNIPFCPSACSFCGFFKKPFQPELESGYVEALLREIEAEGRAALAAGLTLSAVYLGGGTPTALSAASLKRILTALRSSFPLTEDCEISVESRVSTLDEDKLKAIAKGGTTRLSIGVQSFNPEVRRRVGRLDSPEIIMERLKGLSRIDSLVTVIDLIYGLPGQSPAIFEEDLKLSLASGVEGLALYMLKLGPMSPLSRKIKEGREEAPPSLPEMAGYYRLALRLLEESGWKQISNCHWTANDRDRNLYNSLSAGRHSILSLGAGAGGSVDGTGFANTSDLGKYIGLVNSGLKPLAKFWPAAAGYQLLNDLSRQINEGWFDFSLLPGLTEARWLKVEELLNQWSRAGLVTLTGRAGRLTPAGIYWTSNLEYGLRSLLAGFFDRP